MNTFQNERALVLGGGGSAGNAWLIGVLAGLSGGGLDVTGADLVVGTSAGATAAAQLGGAEAPALLGHLLSAVPPARPARAGGDRPAGPGPMHDNLRRTNEIISESADLADLRRRVGADALTRSPDPAWQQQWRAIVATRFSNHDWPGQRTVLTVIDARTGDPVELDAGSGVDLVDAVAASTAGGGLAYEIGGVPYLDGGYRRSSENADLAAGYGRVLVLSPLGGRTRWPLEWNAHLAVQVEELRAGGSAVETVLPDGASLAAFGDNMMNPATRPPAAHAGHAQGLALAPRLAEFWT